jgi:hypothetical protein
MGEVDARFTLCVGGRECHGEHSALTAESQAEKTTPQLGIGAKLARVPQ